LGIELSDRVSACQFSRSSDSQRYALHPAPQGHRDIERNALLGERFLQYFIDDSIVILIIIEVNGSANFIVQLDATESQFGAYSAFMKYRANDQ
jgi:hypothetical protein